MKILMVFTAILIVIYPGPASAGWPQLPSVHAEGKATKEVTPDKASITFYIRAFDAQSEAALEQLHAQTEVALAVLKAADIPDKDITAFNLSKQVERSNQDRNELEILGYYISREFRVELEDLDKFSSLAAGLMEVNNLTSVRARFDVSERDRIEAALVLEAASDARAKAENMARGMSVEIASVLSISQDSYNSYSARFALRAPAAMPMAADSRSQLSLFMPATITVSETVNVLFEIENE